MTTATQMEVSTIRMAIPMLGAAVAADEPVFLWGQPGVGKTDIVKQVYAILRQQNQFLGGLYIWSTSERNAIDSGGLYRVDENGCTVRCPIAEVDFTQPCFFFIDEFSDAPQFEQSGWYRLFLERTLGDKKLPAGSYVCAAGNRPEDNAAAREVSSALKNRCQNIWIVASWEDTLEYAYENNWSASLCGFVRAYGSEVVDCGFDPDAPYGGCTPRGLARLAKFENRGALLGKRKVGRKLVDLELKQIIGCIDHSAGHKYSAFKSLDLPSPADVFNSPQTAQIMETSDKAYAYSAAIVAACDGSRKQVAACFTYAKRLGRVNGCALMFDIQTRFPQVVKQATWVDVLVEYAELA